MPNNLELAYDFVFVMYLNHKETKKTKGYITFAFFVPLWFKSKTKIITSNQKYSLRLLCAQP